MSTTDTPQALVLCGPMGAGKSTVGARLAAVMGCPFDDVDVCIEGRCGRSIAQIFAHDGEAVFRDIERRCALERIDAGGPRVIALGGGGLTCTETRRRCAQPDVLLVWLRISVATAVARLSGAGTSTRPLWSQGGAQRWLELATEREAHWSVAGVVIDADTSDIDAVVSRVRAAWESAGVR